MAAAPTGPPVPDSLWDTWADEANLTAFRTARSALAAVLAARGIKRVWLPAYVCTALAEGAAGLDCRFYGVDRALNPLWPDQLEPGDAVVTVSYFGKPSTGGRRDVLWIDDRAQALDAGPRWADVTLYSPRKLVGVADGGLLVSAGALPSPTDDGDDSLWIPETARALDPDGLEPSRWYPQFQAREAAYRVDRAAASGRTILALKALSATAAIARRKANWRVLARRLADRALWDDPDPDFAPLAYPIIANDPAALVKALAAERIFCPRHWAELPGGTEEFADARWLSEHLVSLPCDQRYTAQDMSRLADAVLAQPR